MARSLVPRRSAASAKLMPSTTRAAAPMTPSGMDFSSLITAPRPAATSAGSEPGRSDRVSALGAGEHPGGQRQVPLALSGPPAAEDVREGQQARADEVGGQGRAAVEGPPPCAQDPLPEEPQALRDGFQGEVKPLLELAFQDLTLPVRRVQHAAPVGAVLPDCPAPQPRQDHGIAVGGQLAREDLVGRPSEACRRRGRSRAPDPASSWPRLSAARRAASRSWPPS